MGCWCRQWQAGSWWPINCPKYRTVGQSRPATNTAQGVKEEHFLLYYYFLLFFLSLHLYYCIELFCLWSVPVSGSEWWVSSACECQLSWECYRERDQGETLTPVVWAEWSERSHLPCHVAVTAPTIDRQYSETLLCSHTVRLETLSNSPPDNL